MENIINYYYNLYPNELNKMYNGFYFAINGYKFLLIELILPKSHILDIYEKLMKNNIGFYIIILNKDNNPVSNFDNKEYILFQINGNDKEILKFEEQIYISSKSDVNWGKLWSERIDYYEIQINELAQDKRIVLESIYYYIGLAENAISIANKYKNINENESIIQHYRMNVPIKKGDYFNPGNMLSDVFIRNIVEYIKNSFFCEKKEDEYYLEYIKSFNYTESSANLLLARLLYPTYYFDIFDEIILNDKDEDELIFIINLCYDFENLIIKIYDLLQKKYPILNIDWIRKRTINLLQ
ncbi:MAG: hypothetical protein WC277_09720 [Bacilli bacterium]